MELRDGKKKVGVEEGKSRVFILRGEKICSIEGRRCLE